MAAPALEVDTDVEGAATAVVLHVELVWAKDFETTETILVNL